MATPKVKEEAEILSPEVEEIITTEIETSLVKQNVTETLLSRLETEYADFKINGQEDKEGYLTVQSARKDCKRVRVLISKICKAGRAKANAEAKMWVNKENSLTGRVSKIEDRLEADETAWEEERDRRKQLEAQKLEQQGIERTSHMLGFGAVLQDGNWVLGDISYESILVKSCDPDIYQGIYDQFKAIFDEKEKIRLKQEEDQQKAKEELQRQQEELQRQQKEMKDMRTEARISLLKSFGMGKEIPRPGIPRCYVYDNVTVWVSDIEEKDAQDWEGIIAGAREGVEQAKAEAKEKERKKELFQARLARLTGWTYNGINVSCPSESVGGMRIFGSVDDLLKISDDIFEETVKDNDFFLAELEHKKEEKRLKDLEDARLEGLGKSRREMLKAINGDSGLSDLQLGGTPSDVWERDYAIATKLHVAKMKEDAEKTEKDRVELLGEKQRYEEVVEAIKSIKIPAFRSSQYRSKINIIRTFIDDLK